MHPYAVIVGAPKRCSFGAPSFAGAIAAAVHYAGAGQPAEVERLMDQGNGWQRYELLCRIEPADIKGLSQ